MKLDGKQIKTGSVPDSKLQDLYLKANGTRALTGNQSFGGFKATSLANGTAATDAVTKGQLDTAQSSFDWKEPVVVLGLVGNATVATVNGLTPAAGQAYVMTSAGTLTTGSLVVAIGDLVEYSGTAWKKIVTNSGGFVPSGTRAILSTTVALISPYTDATDDGKVISFAGASNTGTAVSPTESYDGASLLITGETGFYENQSYTFDGVVPTGTWIQFGGVGQLNAGNGLTKTGNILDVNVGNGTIISGDAVVLNLATGSGLKFTTAQLAVEPADFAGSGLEDDGSDNLRIAAAAAGNGLTGGAGAALSVLPQNTSIAVAAGGVKAAVPTTSNKNMTALATSSDGQQATATTVVAGPAAGSHMYLLANGLPERVGNGTKVGVPAYISGDAGSTARAFSAVIADDTLHWNGSVAGYQLTTAFRLDLIYNTTG